MSLAATYRLGTRLFWRDRAMLFASVITPIGLAVGLPVLMRHVVGTATAVTVSQGMIAMLLSITAFMNVAVALTNRRDQLVLKRLRASRLTDGQILLGQIAGTATQTVILIVACALAVRLLADVPLPANLLAFAVAVIAGSVVLSLLGAAYTAAIPRAELAAAYTMPVFLVSLVSTGAMGPIPLPSWLQSALDLLPTTAVVTAVRTGDLVLPAVDLAVWAAVGLVAIRLWFRWEPRRS
ncbi:ABC transporter permease [Nonomuraea jiangxiensis]|uniref:ABC-2 type transport system permease protein n=1 Tax=Nonomuraea jiangxiensis TaxID=633440 RepID=A0A1G9F275_9ACTN|nr:ABC transporter permease [Nonomuraea jiangxiensis]SDK82421.1 ABC-2 type transport system permease protein [Nonomuraea jiangxiensis]